MWYRGKSALVTGASSGVGAAFARALAERGMNLLLVALPDEEPQLLTVAQQLTQECGIRVESVPIDLAERTAARHLQAATDSLHFEPDLLVNNAGIGAGGLFSAADLERQLGMVRVNIEALVELTGLYLPRMVARGDGAIINVASTAAFEPAPYFATYAASKAFVLSFSQAIWAEHRQQGVRVVTLCSGPVATAFHQRSGDTEPSSGFRDFIKRRYMSADAVVNSALLGLERDQPVVVQRLPGLNVVFGPLEIVTSLLPRRLRLIATERVNRWYFRQEEARRSSPSIGR
jgi:short-subunit dehydrogenase